MTAGETGKMGPGTRANGGGALPSPDALEAIPGAPESDCGPLQDEGDGAGEAELRSLVGFGRFARVPFGAIRDKRIGFCTLRVLVALGERADNSRSCWPSVAILAKDAACSERTVQRALRVLEHTGYVSTIRGGMVKGRRVATRYTLVYRPDNRPKKRASS